MAGQVRLAYDSQAATITLSNPGRRNSLTVTMLEELISHCQALAKAGDVRALVVTGEGEDFASGADIGEFQLSRTQLFEERLEKALICLEQLTFPVLAVMSGYTLGAGLELALGCDLRMAADNCRLGIPAAKRGLAISRSNTSRLVRLIGVGRAGQLLFTGDLLNTAVALQWGLINEVAAPQELQNRVRDLVQILVQNAPLSLMVAKHNLHFSSVPVSAREEDPANLCYRSEDFQEGVRAFFEKRSAVFIGK